jgi:hypothetical protein
MNHRPAMSTDDVRTGCKADHRFDALGVVRVIEGAQLRGVVTAWPSGVVVEVRRCAACGVTVARKVERLRLVAST